MIGGINAMIKFLLGMVFGGSLGFVWAALLGDGDAPASVVRPEPETDTFVRHDVLKRALEKRRAFTPADSFLSDCPQVCGNCKHWEHELYAWGMNVQICRVSNQPKNCGHICDVLIKDNER